MAEFPDLPVSISPTGKETGIGSACDPAFDSVRILIPQFRAFTVISASPMDLICNECKRPADVVLESFDGIRFNAHSTNLEMYSEGFPPAAAVSLEGDVVRMSESAEILKILLQFMHPQRQPDLRKLSIECLSKLAEAAEKFMVYPAMQACSLRMQTLIKDYPLEVLVYATKFDYPELCDEAGPLTMDVSARAVTKRLDFSTLGAWIVYRDAVERNRQNALAGKPNLYMSHFNKTGDTCHSNWGEFQKEVLYRCAVTSTIKWEQSVRESLHLLGNCFCCHKAVGTWEESIRKAVANTEKFSTFL